VVDTTHIFYKPDDKQPVLPTSSHVCREEGEMVLGLRDETKQETPKHALDYKATQSNIPPFTRQEELARRK
jgi:hypothetical protein